MRERIETQPKPKPKPKPKHISAEEGGSTTYRSRSVEALGLRKQNQDKHVELNIQSLIKRVALVHQTRQ
ncbi:MAG: hypothetical protein MJE68_26495 [Proteobacteria bacterium]|nr:hypothetical protein [Pseudomonadota bacterium]